MTVVRGWRCPAWAAYLAVPAVVIAAYFLVPSDAAKTTLYGLLGLSSAAVTVVGGCASVGVVTATQGDDPERALRRADAAMYEAKAAGRNRVHYAPV